MTRNELANARNRAIDRIVGMIESPEFSPDINRSEMRTFQSLCLAHAAMVAQIRMIDDNNPKPGNLRDLEVAMMQLERELEENPKASNAVRVASGLIGRILDRTPDE